MIRTCDLLVPNQDRTPIPKTENACCSEVAKNTRVQIRSKSIVSIVYRVRKRVPLSTSFASTSAANHPWIGMPNLGVIVTPVGSDRGGVFLYSLSVSFFRRTPPIGSKCCVSVCVFWIRPRRPEPVTFAVVIFLRNLARS